MKNTINRILALCCGLILIGCNSGGSSSSGGSTPVNPTANISLSSGLSSGGRAVNVPTSVNLILNFNEAVNGVNSTTVQVESIPGSLTNVITESQPLQSGNKYTFSLSGLTNNTNYTVSLSNGITSVKTGLPIVDPKFSFTTVDYNIPTVQMIQPVNGSTNVGLNSTVTLQFSEAVTKVSAATLTWISSSKEEVTFTIEPADLSKTTYMLRLASGIFLTPNTVYTVQVKNGIINAGLKPVPLTTFNFTTANINVPTVTLTSPTPITNVIATPTPTITLTFSEAVTGVTNPNVIQFESQPGKPESITIIESGNSYTLIPSTPLLYATQYVVLVNSGIRSVATLASVAPATFNFTTAFPPTVSLTSPNPTTNVIPTPTITLTFSEAVSNVTPSTIQLESTGGQPQNITIIASGNSDIYTLSLPESLLLSTQYQVIVNSGIVSQVTGAPVAPIQFSFRIIGPGFLSSIGTVGTGGTTPTGIVISPDNLNAYVTNYDDNTLAQYSRDSSGVLTSISLPIQSGGANPIGIVISSDGSNVYVANQATATVTQFSRSESGRLTAIDGTGAPVSSGPYPRAISISPDGYNVYVINNPLLGGVNTISQFSRSESGRLTALSTPIATGNGPLGMTVSPDGNNVYVTNNPPNGPARVGDTISQYSRAANGILTALGTIATGPGPQGITISSDGLNGYVVNYNDNTVSQYSRDASGRLTSINPNPILQSGGASPIGIVVSSNGKNAYIINQGNSSLTQFSRSIGGLLTGIGTPFTTGSSPVGIILSPDNSNLYFTNSGSNTVSQYIRY